MDAQYEYILYLSIQKYAHIHRHTLAFIVNARNMK